MNLEEIKKAINENQLSKISIESVTGINKECSNDYMLLKTKFEQIVSQKTSEMLKANKDYKEYLSDLCSGIIDGKLVNYDLLSVEPNIMEVAEHLENKTKDAKFAVRLFEILFPDK